MDNSPVSPGNAHVPRLSSELLSVLACPLDHGDFIYNADEKKLTCMRCNRVYPIVNGVPNMLVKKESMEGVSSL